MNIESVALRNYQSEKSSTTQRIKKWILLISVVALTANFTGCGLSRSNFFDGEIIDAAFGNYRDKVWAKRACNLRFSNCNRPYQEHFQAGFEAGYTAICDGGDGYVPATPPEAYWGFEYQTPDGSQCVKSWFEGYPAGVEAAKRDRAGTYRDVYVSRMIQSAMAQDQATKTTPKKVAVVQTPGSMPAQNPSYQTPVQMGLAPMPSAPYSTGTQLPPIVGSSSNTFGQ